MFAMTASSASLAVRPAVASRRCGGRVSRLACEARAVKKAPPPVEEESVTVPAAVAIGAPVAALAASAAAVGSGSMPKEAFEAYLHTTAQFVFDASAAGQVPEFISHWFHAINMGIVLGAMGGYGAYLGWEIRKGNGGDATLTGGTAADLHPKLMGGMTLFFLAGGQGGVLFTLLQGRPILESPHTITAVAGLALLLANGVLGNVMQDKAALRTTHAFLGTSLMAVFLVHAGLGLAEGFSF